MSISTHAPLAGRDQMDIGIGILLLLFQPTRPLRGATYACGNGVGKEMISTHAPLAGRDGNFILPY